MKNNGESYCRDCGEFASAEMDEEETISFCGACGSLFLLDITDGMKFKPITGEVS